MPDLAELLAAEIRASGPLPFPRFMELCLYHPDHGYYTAGPRRPGVEWRTGPSYHPLFGRTLARGISPLLAEVDRPTLVDAGAGGGELLRDLAQGIAARDPDLLARTRLVLVDRSPANLQLGRETVEAAGLDAAVETAVELPDRFQGVVVANELLDAFPVHLLEVADDGDACRELHVVLEDPGAPTPTFRLEPHAPSTPKLEPWAARALGADAPAGTRFEAPRAALAWTRDATRRLEAGGLLVVDYGAAFPQLLERYPAGTVHGYHRGRRTREILAHPGEQDLTALVPFDLVAEAGVEQGLTTAHHAPQGATLRALGIADALRETGGDGLDALAGRRLVDEAGAGGTFQVLLQTRGVRVDEPWPGMTGFAEPPTWPVVDEEPEPWF